LKIDGGQELDAEELKKRTKRFTHPRIGYWLSKIDNWNWRPINWMLTIEEAADFGLWIAESTIDNSQ